MWAGKNTKKILARAEDVVLASLLALIVGITLLQVAFRYLLGAPLRWTDEVARLLFVWLTFVGAAIVLRRGQHIRVAILVDRLEGRSARVLNAVASLVGALVMGAVTYLTILWLPTLKGTRTPAVQAPMVIFYIPLLVCTLYAMVTQLAGGLLPLLRRSAHEDKSDTSR